MKRELLATCEGGFKVPSGGRRAIVEPSESQCYIICILIKQLENREEELSKSVHEVPPLSFILLFLRISL